MTNTPTTDSRAGELVRHPATFTCDKSKVGPLYYFAVADRAPGPYKTQRHVEAIIDIADDGTLAGVELIDSMPPPPLAQQALRTTEGGEVEPVASRRWDKTYPGGQWLYFPPDQDGEKLVTLAQLSAVTAENARLREALNLIDALDPEEHIYGTSHDACRGLIIRMGQMARAALNPKAPS